MEKRLLKETETERVYIVDADSFEEFLEKEMNERIDALDDQGPYGRHQEIEFIKLYKNIPIIIIGIALLSAHIYARLTIGI